MNPKHSLLSGLVPEVTTHAEPLAFVDEVLARAADEGLALVVAPIDVPFRYFWEWRGADGRVVREREEVLSVNAEEVKLRACLQFCREMGWPIAYSPGRNIHLDLEAMPNREEGDKLPAATLRGAGVYVPDHVHDFELVEVAR